MDSASTASARVVAAGAFQLFAELVDSLGIPRVEVAPVNAFFLIEVEAGLELRPPREPDRSGIRALFPPDQETRLASARSPLAKAFGKKITSVYDLTAGLGGDSYRLALAGYRVRAWERNPAVFALLSSGWRASVAEGRVPAELAERVAFHWGDSMAALEEFRGSALGAYFDPMYPPPKRSSALPKRPVQVLRELLEGESEPIELVAAARERLSRVVVKRPRHAAPLVEGASFAIETKLVRFDVYLNPTRMESADS
ncbi:MAG: class I SAM-dependent methyltransferase [Myxococcota bacterium]